jgi:diguanylate cyclase (GGDEF)-like protein/PAS domain S-box-containing protein
VVAVVLVTRGRTVALVACLAGGAAGPAAALDPRRAITQYGHDAWTTRDGLPQNTVHGVAQTPDGYLWLATSVGLVRFDGVRFTLFDKTTSGLRHDHIWGVTVTRDGALWAGTDGGGVARLQGGRWTTFTTQEGLAHDIVRAIREAPDGTVWIATNGGGVSRYKDGVFTRLDRSDGLPTNLTWALQIDADGTVWIGTNGGGLVRWQAGATRTFTAADGLPNNSVWCLYRDSAQTLWIGTGAGLARQKGDRFERVLPADEHLGTVRAMVEDRHGNLWLGSTGGLGRLTRGRLEVMRGAQGLSADFVRALYEDREGSLWIGTFGGGLDRLRDGRFTVYGTVEGLSHDFVQPILEARDGSVWIGTNRRGLNRLKDGRVTVYTKADGLTSDSIFSLAEGRDGTLWIGTNGGGLVRFQGGRFRAYHTADGLPSEMVRSVLEDSEGTLWVGTADGLARLREGKVASVYRAEDGLPGTFVTSILEGHERRIWLGTTRGLACWKDGRISAWTAAEGLTQTIVQCLYQDETGALWIGTNGGGMFRLQDDRFGHVTARDGLADDVVHAIVGDRLGHLWLTSHRGISRVARADLEQLLSGRLAKLTVESFDATDGMRSSECTGGFCPAAWRGRDGRLWFPTVRGAVSVDPAEDHRNEREPPVVIEEVTADGRPVAAGATLAPGTERLAFRYTGLSLRVPGKVRFRHRLEGFEERWTEGPQREATYTHLPPRTYTFRVMAANEDGVWNQTGASFEVRLQPYFHQTPWFYALVVVFAGILAWVFHERRVRQLRTRETELAQRVEERTTDLQSEVAERWRVEQALRESEERYALAVRGANDGVWDWNRETDRIYFSARWKAILGYEDHEIGDRPSEWLDRVHPDDLERLRLAIDAHCAGQLPHLEDEHRIRHRDGSYRWVLCRGFGSKGGDGRVYRMVGVQTDVTDRRSYDPLTSLPNRTLFAERLNRSLVRARHQADHRVAVLFMDLDRFKLVNDSLGHHAGDRLLVAIARQLESCVRPGDMIARLGGDEFAILVDAMSGVEDATRVAERILKVLAVPFTIGGHEVFTSVSIGIATSAGESPSDDLLRDADTAMYRAKAKGRSRFEIFDAAMRAQVTSLLELEGDLRRAVERGQIRVAYQPIVSLETGHVLGFEALARWPHPRRGLVYPADFIGLAEDTGLIVPMGYQILDQACRQLQAWTATRRDGGEPLSITVNVSGRQFIDEGFVRHIGQTLRETGLDPACLGLEITESVLLEAGGAGTLAELKGLGVRLYIDDFGTGYCSLDYLHRFPVDSLKIDRTFVGRIGEEGESGALVRAIVTLARSLEIATVAEGVETEAQVRELVAIGCDRAQGHYFAAALEPEAAAELLTSGWRWEFIPPATWSD